MGRLLSTTPLLLAGMISQAEARIDTAVDLELALAVDVSRSIDANEARLQRQGYIAAFRDPDVIHAIRAGMLGRIAVTYFEWAGMTVPEAGVDWTVIDDDASALAFAEERAERATDAARPVQVAPGAPSETTLPARRPAGA